MYVRMLYVKYCIVNLLWLQNAKSEVQIASSNVTSGAAEDYKFEKNKKLKIEDIGVKKRA